MRASRIIGVVFASALFGAPAAAQTRIGPPMLTTPGADEWYLRTPDSVSLYIREFGQANRSRRDSEIGEAQSVSAKTMGAAIAAPISSKKLTEC